LNGGKVQNRVAAHRAAPTISEANQGSGKSCIRTPKTLWLKHDGDAAVDDRSDSRELLLQLWMIVDLVVDVV
jgi:hypothetical protein